MKPFLRWAGSKRQLLPKLTQFWNDDFGRYVEPFMGSACLFFCIEPQEALLGDINAELVETFLAVREHPRAVHNALNKLPRGKRAYYQIRKASTAGMSAVERAARFVYLNRFCFNGLYRTNLRGEFNVPFSGGGTGDLPTFSQLKVAARALRRAEIRCGDFEDAIAEVSTGDFVYLDPPFAVRGRRVFSEYAATGFGHADLPRLREALKAIDSVGANFVVSYADSREGRHILSGWCSCRVRTKRNIAGFSQHRRHAYEIIATNLRVVQPNSPGHGKEVPEANAS